MSRRLSIFTIFMIGAIYSLQIPCVMSASVVFHFTGTVSAVSDAQSILPNEVFVGNVVTGSVQYDSMTEPTSELDGIACYYLTIPSRLSVSLANFEVSSDGPLSASVTNVGFGDGSRDYSFVLQDGESTSRIADQQKNPTDSGNSILVDGLQQDGMLAVGFDTFGFPVFGESLGLPGRIRYEDFILRTGSIGIQELAPFDTDRARIDFSINRIFQVPEPSGTCLTSAGILAITAFWYSIGRKSAMP